MRISRINNSDILSCFPEELSLLILSNLNAASLAVVNFVCKHWNQLSKKDALLFMLNVKTLFMRTSFIDAAAWQANIDLAKYGLSFEGQAVNQCKMIKELQKCLAWPIEKINGVMPGVTVVTILKGLSVNKLRALAPLKVFGWVHPEFIQNYGDIEVSDAYTIIITDHVMNETRAKNTTQKLIEIKKHGGERPKAIEAITLLTLTFLISGKRLYDEGQVVLHGKEQKLSVYTQCEEQISGNQVLVGDFDSAGFGVSDHSYVNDYCGLGAVRNVLGD